jgi:SNF2 family DNA or RNA helicase
MVAVVQVRSGGTGISFASASHALFVSRGFSFADDEQARDRVYARGAARCVTYYQARNTVDDFIAAVLSSKQDVHDAVTKADKETMAYGYINRKARA